MEHFDAIIIGFGKGGKLLAADLANRGQQVAIIERSAAMYGGSCINIACIPTKALIHQAQMIKELNLASFEEKAAAYRKAIIKKNEITTALRKLNFDRLNDHPNITVYTGVASFRSSRKIEVTTETDRLEIEGKRIFIDTGALPVIPPISGIRESRRVYTSTSLLELDLLPETLVIIGGGYIGLEFASMFAAFGSKVIVLENTTEFLSREDRTIAEAVRKRFNQKGTLSVPSYPGILNVSSLPIAQETTNTRTKRIRPINDFIALTGLSFNAEPNWNIAAITVAATASPNSAYIKYSNASVLAGCHISGSTPDNAAAPVASPPK